MEAKQIMELALKNIKREDVLKTSLFVTGGTSPTDEQQEVFDDIFDSINDSLMAISYIYIPQKTKEEVVITNGQLSYESLSKTLIDVVRIQNKCGVSQKFLTYPNYVKCSNGTFEITYTYQPDVLEDIDDELDIENKNISPQLVSLGTVANFYLKRGLFDESLKWEKMFKEQIVLCKRKNYVPEIKGMVW